MAISRKLIPLVINKSLNQEKIPIYGDGSNIRDWLFVEDHVDALLLCAQKGTPGKPIYRWLWWKN